MKKEHATRSQITWVSGPSSITYYYVILANHFIFLSLSFLTYNLVIIILALPPSQGC